MGIDFDDLYSVCQYSFNELKKCMVEIHSKKQKGTLRYQTPDVIMHKISEMFSNLNKALSDSESFHLDYLYIICHLEALSALLWVLKTHPDCVKNKAEVFQGKETK